MKVITAAIAGLGPRGYQTYGQYQNLFPERMKVVAIADTLPNRVLSAAKDLKIDEKNCFTSAEDMFAQPKLADVAIIATQDSQHVFHAIMAIQKGYDLLLEKPIASTLKDCLKIKKESILRNKLVAVCHVLRYTTFYRTIKQIIDTGEIGDVVTINAVENVGYWHQAHSFVRGNWRNSETSSPMILAKCCHDLDILNYLTGKTCLRVSSYGSNKFFKSKNQPNDAADRCLDCKYQDTCQYSAKLIYLSNESLKTKEWPCYVVSPEPTLEKLSEALKTGIYGKCVFKCDNNVVDHQIVNIQYDEEVTASLTMSAFSNNIYRTIRIMGTKGEIDGSQDSNIVKCTVFGEEERIYDINKLATDLSGHSGGDNQLMTDFLEKLISGKQEISSSIINSMQSHIMAFAAEESRSKNGKSIELNKFVK